MNLKITKNTFLVMVFLVGMAGTSFAQMQSSLDIGLRYMEGKYQEWGLERADINDFAISNQYQSKHNGVTHLYFIQRHAGIEVYNAITSVHVTPNGKVLNVGNRFIANLESKVNTTSPQISATQAIQYALGHLGQNTKSDIIVKEQISNKEFVFSKGDYSLSDVPVTLRFQPTKENGVRLAWDLAIDQMDGSDYWSIRVDAETGELLDKISWTSHCKFVDDPYHRHGDTCTNHNHATATVEVAQALKSESSAMMGGSYRVFGEDINGVNSPFESPIHGDRTLMVEPFDVTYSPFGWHDTNGEEGAEFTITRGNNVHAYLDLNNTSNPTGEPDGGEELVFDYPYDANNEPEDQRDAAVTNLFYMVNTIHDYSANFGFDEAAGNFQRRNYTGVGGGGDHVLAEAQDGNGSVENINNANFSTPPDGSSGRMQMYLWDQAGGKLLTVNSPVNLEGTYETGTADFGPMVTETPISGEVAIAFDNSSEPNFGCNTLANDNLEGKIALVDRGGCFFEEKTANAEAAGAIACIICNFENSTMGMAGVPEIDDPSIPTVSIGSVDCSLFKAAIEEGLTVTLQLPSSSGPALLDGDFDNGIIAHEFAHGISNRLTGGPSAAGCLGNGEQMGEGWSDFFSLVTSVKPGDTGDMRRGIGTYVERQTPSGSGIRPLPYSTDMTTNNHTYDDVIRFSGSVHSVGAVWNQMLWDLYWALVEEHGFDLDYTNAEAGNNMAVQLVMDGMKFQPCSPGFVDGRDAILGADIINYDGANQCLIWEVFARRGLGYLADQGTSASDSDGVSNFEPLPTCIKELKIVKTGTDLINPMDVIDYTIVVTNHKDDAVTNVVVTDLLPEGCSYVMGSASNGGTNSANMISWELGTMETGDEITLTYQVQTPNEGSTAFYKDDFEVAGTVQADWVSYTLDLEFADNWSYENNSNNAFSGDRYYFATNDDSSSDQVLQLNQPFVVTGEQPALRFYHDYDTEKGKDGGFLQVSTDGGISWVALQGDVFRNNYDGQVSYQTFTIPFQQAYSGNSNGYIDSYVDLSDYVGETLFFRWRFGTDESNGGNGWAIDDVTFMDVLNYNTEACVSSDEGDNACDDLPQRGTIVEAGTVAAQDIQDPTLGMRVFPNPAQDFLTISLTSEFAENADLSIVSLDGRTVRQMDIATNGGMQNETINVSDLSSGFYFVRITTPRGINVQKVVID